MNNKIITCVEKDTKGNIVKCKVDGVMKTKESIIKDINNGETYRTKNEKGPEVNVVDNKWLRTDGNDIKSDNLDAMECKK